jgi:hypothetical protein
MALRLAPPIAEDDDQASARNLLYAGVVGQVRLPKLELQPHRQYTSMASTTDAYSKDLINLPGNAGLNNDFLQPVIPSKMLVVIKLQSV